MQKIPLPQPPPGIRQYINKEGMLVSEVHPSADPHNTLADHIARRPGPGELRRIYDRENNLDDSIHTGEPVYPQYDKHVHEIMTGRVEFGYDDLGLKKMTRGFVAGSILVCGFDWGHTPAFIAWQLTPWSCRYQVQSLVSIQVFNGSAAELKPMVVEWLSYYPGGDRVFVADPSGKTADQADGVSCFDIFADPTTGHIPIMEGNNDPLVRRESMAYILTREIAEGVPGFVLDYAQCESLGEGLRGGYKLGEVTGPDGLKRYSKPQKNQHSHPVEAAEQCAIFCTAAIKQWLNPPAKEPEREYEQGETNH